MKIFSRVTPISYNKINNLSITDYMFIYMDKNKQLKRAIPDFDERFISYEDSLINEVFNADKVGVFRILSKRSKVASPIFNININDDGTIDSHNSNNNIKIENLLLDSKKRETVSKLLKKRK